MARWGTLLTALDAAILAVFVAEILLRIAARRAAFFRDPWSVFDFVVVAIALFAGQRGSGAARLALFAMPIAWLAGGLVGARWPESAAWPLSTTLTFAVAGALVALNATLRDTGVALLAVVAGLLHGLVNGATTAPAGATPLALAGAITAIFCVTAILSAEVTALPAGWPRVAVRVAGSWIAAAGLLMLGWLLRPGG